MPDRPRPDGEEEILRGLNRALSEQVQRLVRTEQRLSRSQREVARQMRRVDGLNRMVLRAVATPEPNAIFESAMDLLFSTFPYEQGLGILAMHSGFLEPISVGSVPGRAGVSDEGLRRLQARGPLSVRVPADPVMGSVARVLERGDATADLLRLQLEVFGDASETPAGMVLVLPLAGPHPNHGSALILRRTSELISFHDSFPKDDDRGFLDLVAQQVGVALTNAHLVTSLKRSYAELELAQNELVIRERLAAIGQLAAVVAHEIRNPLGAIINSLSTLGHIAEPRGEVAQLLGIMREETYRVNRIVTDLINFARPGVLSKREQDLAPIAQEAVSRAVAQTDGRQIQVVLHANEKARAMVDEHLLRQALINLIENATDASDPDGRVDVHVRQDGSAAEVEVVNRGMSIADEDIERIFEPFFTTKASGTGLGLAVVKRFADAHEGHVSVTSCPRAETVFTIRWGG